MIMGLCVMINTFCYYAVVKKIIFIAISGRAPYVKHKNNKEEEIWSNMKIQTKYKLTITFLLSVFAEQFSLLLIQ